MHYISYIWPNLITIFFIFKIGHVYKKQTLLNFHVKINIFGNNQHFNYYKLFRGMNKEMKIFFKSAKICVKIVSTQADLSVA